MVKVTVLVGETPDTAIPASALPIGGLGIVRTSARALNGDVVYRVYDRLVSLNTPEATWLVGNNYPSFKVEPILGGTAVTLIAPKENKNDE